MKTDIYGNKITMKYLCTCVYMKYNIRYIYYMMNAEYIRQSVKSVKSVKSIKRPSVKIYI